MSMLLAAPTGTELKWPRFPYPGLRPFRIGPDGDESLIFHGRNAHKDDILERLDTSQLVSVIGPSGCGKSSLVKVGVIPALMAGLLTRAGYDWLAVGMRPGNDPLGNLAASLAGLGGGDHSESLTPPEHIHQTLETERSALWLILEHFREALQQEVTSSRPRRVLLLIDQFEEIFTGVSDKRAVDQFVGLIAQFFRRPHPQLYLILTMRTDFIDQCASFPGLAEILNRTQYITPVLRGADLREAIARPGEAYHGEIEDALVSEIVQDMGAGSSYDADHLPLMQHALLWLWLQSWRDIGVAEPPTPVGGGADGRRACLTVAKYREHGGLSGILRLHADQVLGEVRTSARGDERTRIAEVMFRRLSERDASLRYRRAPASVSAVGALADCDVGELEAVVDSFSGPEASFVERRIGRDVQDPVLDLNHEALIRQWSRLREWADDEADKADMLRKITDDALAWEARQRSRDFLKTGGHLGVIKTWWEQNHPTAAWAGRYRLAEGRAASLADYFPLVEEFLQQSRTAQRRADLWRRLRYVLPVVILAAFVLLQSWWMVEASKNRSRMVVMQGDLARRNVSQTLALNTALEVLEQRNGLRSVPEAEVLAREALERLREVYAISISHPFPTGEYSPDGTQLVTVSGGRVKLIDAATGQSRDVEWSGSQDALYARWNPAGDSILVGTADGAVFVLSGRDPGRPGYFSQAARLGQDPPGWGTFSADGRVIATVRNDGTIRLWNSAAVGQGPMARIPHSGSLGWNAFALSADGTRAAVLVSSSEIQVFDIANGRADAQGTPLRPRPPRPAGAAAARGAEAPRLDPISLFAFDPTNANRVLLAWGGEAAILDIADETLLSIRERETTRGRRIWNAAFNRDGTLIATAHDDGGARVWSGQTGIWQATLREHRSGVVSVRFSPDGQHIATGGQDQTIRIWNLTPPGTNEIPKDAKALVAFARGRLSVRDGKPVVLTDDDRCAVGILASQQCRRSE